MIFLIIYVCKNIQKRNFEITNLREIITNIADNVLNLDMFRYFCIYETGKVSDNQSQQYRCL